MHHIKKRTVEDEFKISLKELKTNGFKYGSNLQGTITLIKSNTEKGAIGFQISNDCMLLSYQYRNKNNLWEQVNQEVNFTYLNCNYGNKRIYFECPKCSKRVMTLYYIDRYFYCRECNELTYSSQQETRVYRLLRKTNKIYEKLNTNINLASRFIDRPKWMHTSTYNRRLQELRDTMRKYKDTTTPSNGG